MPKIKSSIAVSSEEFKANTAATLGNNAATQANTAATATAGASDIRAATAALQLAGRLPVDSNGAPLGVAAGPSITEKAMATALARLTGLPRRQMLHLRVSHELRNDRFAAGCNR